jgi:hypothetical protein
VSAGGVQRWGRHREVLVDPGKHHRLGEGCAAHRWHRVEWGLAVGDPGWRSRRAFRGCSHQLGGRGAPYGARSEATRTNGISRSGDRVPCSKSGHRAGGRPGAGRAHRCRTMKRARSHSGRAETHPDSAPKRSARPRSHEERRQAGTIDLPAACLKPPGEHATMALSLMPCNSASVCSNEARHCCPHLLTRPTSTAGERRHT